MGYFSPDDYRFRQQASDASNITSGIIDVSRLGSGTNNTGLRFLRDDGTWQVPPGGGGLTDGDYGDIVVSVGGTVMMLDAAVAAALVARGSHTGTQTASTISDFATTVASTAALKANNLSDLANAATAFVNIKQAATTTETGVVELATNGENAANVAVQGNDARLSDARTPTAHSHAAAEITSGIIDPARLGTGGASTDFLRKDGTWATPSGGGGGADIKAATVTAPYDVTEHSEVVVDAAVSPASQIVVTWGACTDDDENHPAMDSVRFMAVPGTGNLTISVFADEPFGGPFKLNYLVG